MKTKERPVRSATREMWEPSVLGVLEKLESYMTNLLAILTEVKEAVSTKPVLDQRSAEKMVEDPADELKEMAEAREMAGQAENAAAVAEMADLKQFEESRTRSIGTVGMQLVYGEIEALTEERSHAGDVFPGVLKTEHWLSMIGERNIVRQGAVKGLPTVAKCCGGGSVERTR